MSDIMEQNSSQHTFFFFAAYFVPLGFDDFYGGCHQVHGPDGVVEARVQCPGIHQVRQPELLDSAQPLKVWMLNQIGNEIIGNRNKAVHRIVKYFPFV